MKPRRSPDIDPVTRVAPILLSSAHDVDDSMVGELPLHVLLAGEVMQAALRSAGHTTTTFMLEWRGVQAVRLHRRER